LTLQPARFASPVRGKIEGVKDADAADKPGISVNYSLELVAMELFSSLLSKRRTAPDERIFPQLDAAVPVLGHPVGRTAHQVTRTRRLFGIFPTRISKGRTRRHRGASEWWMDDAANEVCGQLRWPGPPVFG
jgi:hypothetical protein